MPRQSLVHSNAFLKYKRLFPLYALFQPRPFGLFKGLRTYTLAPTGNGSVTFTMHEVFSGPMLGMIRKSIPDMTDAFHQFVAGLKSRAEGAK